MNTDRAGIERNLARLASERTSLFNRSGHSFGLSPVEQNRLRAIERELDESFGALREMRAVRDASRFSREDPVVRRAIIAKREATAKPSR